jgi:hypothetical protein
MKTITAVWSGRYPCLCFGTWAITINGKQLPIPEDRVKSPMGTEKYYDSWHFDENWQEVFESYLDGSPFEDWLQENVKWLLPALRAIEEPLTQEECRVLYDAINEADFRMGSCGGCI